ncbi:MAG TPA: deoxyribonuclease IV [Chroococcales cyanobacterium]
MATKKSLNSERPIIGAHISGGIKNAVPRAIEIGAETVQIFIGSPQMWKEPNPRAEDIQDFGKGIKKNSINPVFVHGNYLVNLASESPQNLSRSIGNLATALRISDHIGAQGLIFHPGSAGKATYEEAVKRVLRALDAVLDSYTGKCRLLLEVCAGQGQTIGDRFCEIAEILASMGYDKRLGVCWDTCHLFNAGYDLSTKKGLDATIEEFGELIGFEWLFAIHANDSKTPLGARRDRHENIGFGHIGEAAFRRMLNHKLLRPLPWILEVPGLEKKGPDRANIELLQKLSQLN